METSGTVETQGQHAHAMLPVASAEERSRQEFVKSLKFHLATRIAPGNRDALRASGREAGTPEAVAAVLGDHPYYRFWSALQRNSQELMWKSVQLSVERQLEDLLARAAEALEGEGGATLRLDPALPLPRYHGTVDIHCMPGGYHGECVPGDLANGAVYDRAVYLYAMGRLGPLNSDIGDSAAAFVRQRFPALAPRRILDLGCTVGHSTLPWVEAFPSAEVHAIDVAAPVLRYAHARARALGKTVHFSQQNAESTGFPDAHFDLIVSHILVHETSHAAIRRIMREAYRLLSPGGVVLHVETPPYRALEPYDAFMLDWDTRNNNEPFWRASHAIEPATLAGECGFDPAAAFEATTPSVFGEAEARRTRVFQAGDFGGAGAWYLWGARK